MKENNFQPTQPKIFFIGLGVMGFPMAAHLFKAGRNITVFNRNSAKALQWQQQYGGKITTDINESLSADIIITCVSDDKALEDIFLNSYNLFNNLSPDTIIIDHSTVTATLTRNLFNIAKSKKCEFLDAPVSGGQSGAEKGILTLMVGGDEAAFNKIKPVLSAYSKNSVYIGPSGTGQLTKMVNQICIAGVIQGLAEGLAFAKKAGLNQLRVIQAINQGAAASWQMLNRAETMIDNKFDFGFAVNLMKKDLMICLSEAEANNSLLPVTKLVNQFYAKLQQQNCGHLDTSSLIKLLLED